MTHLQRRANNLHGIDDTGLDHVAVLCGPSVKSPAGVVLLEQLANNDVAREARIRSNGLMEGTS